MMRCARSGAFGLDVEPWTETCHLYRRVALTAGWDVMETGLSCADRLWQQREIALAARSLVGPTWHLRTEPPMEHGAKRARSWTPVPGGRSLSAMPGRRQVLCRHPRRVVWSLERGSGRRASGVLQ